VTFRRGFFALDVNEMKEWIASYIAQQKAALDSIPVDGVAEIIGILQKAHKEDRQVFIFGNGGSASNASHFITDLGKGSSDKLSKRFRCMSLNDNISWITALGNDYSYEDVYVRQLMNFAKPGDVVMTLSVSGNSPNLVKAFDWAGKNGLQTIALVGAKRGKLAQIAQKVIVINSEHYGRVEDAHMGICHMLCYAFMEIEQLRSAS
jgi:D-sedoheptulose 7-phosphate isomerase